MLKKCLYLFLLLEKVGVPWWEKDLVPQYTHTNTQSCLSSVFTVTHSSTSVGRLPRWHWAVDIIFYTKSFPLKFLGILARKRGELPSRSSSLGAGLSPLSILIGPGHQLSVELCQQPSSWDSLPYFSLPTSFFLRLPEWLFFFLTERPDFVFPLLKVPPWFLNTQGEPWTTVLCRTLWTVDILNL